ARAFARARKLSSHAQRFRTDRIPGADAVGLARGGIPRSGRRRRKLSARDFTAAYNFISAADRKIRDLDRYLRQRGPYRGFALEAARRLGEFIEVQVLGMDQGDGRARIAVRYRVPDPEKIAPLLLQWEPRRLN